MCEENALLMMVMTKDEPYSLSLNFSVLIVCSYRWKDGLIDIMFHTVNSVPWNITKYRVWTVLTQHTTNSNSLQLTHCSYLHVCLWNFEYVETRVSPFLLYNMLFWLHIQNIAASSNMGDIQQWWHPQWSPDLSSQNWVMSLNLVLNVQTADEVLYKPFS